MHMHSLTDNKHLYLTKIEVSKYHCRVIEGRLFCNYYFITQCSFLWCPKNGKIRCWQFEWNHFQCEGRFRLKQCPPLTLTRHPPSAVLVSPLSSSALMYGWCMAGGAPVKPCIHAKIHFTSAALISLQPEAHKLPQCIWRQQANAAYGHCWELDIQQAMLPGQDQLRIVLLMFVSQFNTGRKESLPLYQKMTRNNNLCSYLISWVHVGKCLHIAACFMLDLSLWILVLVSISSQSSVRTHVCQKLSLHPHLDTTEVFLVLITTVRIIQSTWAGRMCHHSGALVLFFLISAITFSVLHWQEMQFIMWGWHRRRWYMRGHTSPDNSNSIAPLFLLSYSFQAKRKFLEQEGLSK